MIKVLIVEDEKITREYIKYVIKEYQLDFELLEASNGLEAIKLSRVFKPDLIIIDIHMAEMDGLESSKILKDELPDVKIIILTAYDQFDYAQQAVKIQINDYLLKPISPEDLVEAIERVLKKEIPIKEKNMMDKDLKKSSDVNVNKAIEYISKNYCIKYT